jgi:hypothetical protein
MRARRDLLFLFAPAVAVVAAAPACAQSEIVGPEAFDGQIDLRASVVGGERGWLDGGFGKLRESGDAGGGTEARLDVAAVDLAWKPRFGFALSGLVSVTHQDGASNDLDLNEAYLKFSSGPGETRIDLRAGVFWPPVSLEHGGSNWGVIDTITPSAVNSWIGEEVKVLGAEAAVERTVGEHEFVLTGAVFKHDDMSGTLLSYRGWALHDLRVTPDSDMPLPPLSPIVAPYQATITSPFWEADGRVGYYARFDWRPPERFALNLFRYDNRGDRLSGQEMQTAWRTHFWNLGGVLAIDGATEAKGQMLWGNTKVGPDTPTGYPVDVDFAAAYLLVGRTIGGGKLSLRGDWFETRDNSRVVQDNNNEDGWAATIAYKHSFGAHVDALAEVLHVESDRPARTLLAGIAADQRQTIGQASLRLHF